MAVEIKEPEVKTDPVIDEMTKAGLQFGHKTSKTHPKMKPFISGVRNTVHMIDLAKTKTKLEAAMEYLLELKAQGKVILFVGTKVQHKPVVKDIVETCNVP